MIRIKEHNFVYVCDCTLLCFREEIEKQQAKERYMKLHLEGKTDQARADLARLAIIKKQREDAAKKREDQKKGKKTSSILATTASFDLGEELGMHWSSIG